MRWNQKTEPATKRPFCSSEIGTLTERMFGPSAVFALKRARESRWKWAIQIAHRETHAQSLDSFFNARRKISNCG
jgi:hypothetical protein